MSSKPLSAESGTANEYYYLKGVKIVIQKGEKCNDPKKLFIFISATPKTA